MPDIYNEANLRKNSVTEEEIDQIMRSRFSLWLPPESSARGNARAMIVGFTLNARLLEVGIEILPDPEETLLYFHAMDATKPYRQKFEKLR